MRVRGNLNGSCEETQMEEKAFLEGITRRDFSKAATAAAVGLTVAGGISRAAEEGVKEKEAPKEEAKAPKIPLRDLGKTGLKVTEISLGTMEVTDAAVVEKAIDEGCNYIDTAASYQGGRNEEMVGTVMARRRKEVTLATKFSQSDDKEKIFRSVDRSLRRLQTDVIDVIQVHNVTDASPVKEAVYKEAFDELKGQGKVRFLGFTTHSGQEKVINACIAAGYVDVMLVGFGATDPPEVADAIKRAREAGIGIVIMKSLKGVDKFKGRTSGPTPYQLALRWVLDKPYIDTVAVGMTSFAQLEEDMKALHVKISALDKVQLQRFARACATTTCSLCGRCNKCAQGVKVGEIMRAHMYAHSYGNVKKARSEFLEMGGPAMLAACKNCGACEKSCPRKLQIRKRFREVSSLIA